jgi:hypothetical protein
MTKAKIDFAELQAAGCVKIYWEKASGAKTDRHELAKLLRVIEPGDVLIATRLGEIDAGLAQCAGRGGEGEGRLPFAQGYMGGQDDRPRMAASC